jgi:hypothetical protein
MARCRYEACRSVGQLDEEGRCVECAVRLVAIRQGIQSGMLPRPKSLRKWAHAGLHENQGGMPCQGCGDMIQGYHFSMVHSDPRQNLNTIVHLHEVCHEIWQQEAPFD